MFLLQLEGLGVRGYPRYPLAGYPPPPSLLPGSRRSAGEEPFFFEWRPLFYYSYLCSLALPWHLHEQISTAFFMCTGTSASSIKSMLIPAYLVHTLASEQYRSDYSLRIFPYASTSVKYSYELHSICILTAPWSWLMSQCRCITTRPATGWYI
jgi:hypothetical protein